MDWNQIALYFQHSKAVFLVWFLLLIIILLLIAISTTAVIVIVYRITEEARGNGLDPVKHVTAPHNLLLTVPRRYLLWLPVFTYCYVRVYMVCSNMVTCITAAHYASCFVL